MYKNFTKSYKSFCGNGKITFRLTSSLRTPGLEVRYELLTKEKRLRTPDKRKKVTFLTGIRNEVRNDKIQLNQQDVRDDQYKMIGMKMTGCS
jgi:hypothetical protein